MAEPGMIESQPETNPSPDTSKQLALYLFGVDSLKGGPSKFPNQFSFNGTYEVFGDYMRELDGQRPRVTQEHLLGIKIEDEVEVSKTIYYDGEMNSVRVTDPVQGDHGSVRSSITKAYDAYKRPLIEMHTHSEESLPSVEDYQFILMGNPEAKSRAIRAIAVLCPKIQILALATDQTPILTPDQLRQLFAEWDEPNGKDEKYLKTLKNRWERVLDIVVEAHKVYQEKISEKSNKDTERTTQDVEAEDDFSRVLAKATRIGPKASAKYGTHVRKAFTRLQLQFAKEMGIKLYISTDFKNFAALPDQLLSF